MSTHKIFIEQDSLEYTPRNGLRTRERIPLTVGSHNQVIIRRPARIRAASAFGTFRKDSAFPNATSVAVLLGRALSGLLDGLSGERGKQVVQVFGHASPSGDEAHNKALSERRARAFAALLTGASEDFEAIGEEEGWGLEQHQFMLRVLRCDPGPIDGREGDLTTQAIEWFQLEYRDGLFHRAGRTPRQPDLEPTSKLDGPTKRALLEAFCESVSPLTAESELHPINPVIGCSEFNLVPQAKDPSVHRRVTLVVNDKVLPFAENAPCSVGDHTTCSLDARSPHRCLWYRDHVLEPNLRAVEALHFDLRWLPLENGKVLLTALTTLPEEAPVTFQVFKTDPILNAAEIREEVLQHELSQPMEGEVVLGVAQVVWDPPDDFDIHDFAAWQAKNRATDPLEAWNNPAGATVPVFRVSGGGASYLSPPPGADLDRVMCVQAPNDSGIVPTGVIAWDAFGNQYFVPLENGRPPQNLHALADELPRVVAVGYSDADIEDQPGTRGIL